MDGPDVIVEQLLTLRQLRFDELVVGDDERLFGQRGDPAVHDRQRLMQSGRLPCRECEARAGRPRSRPRRRRSPSGHAPRPPLRRGRRPPDRRRPWPSGPRETSRTVLVARPGAGCRRPRAFRGGTAPSTPRGGRPPAARNATPRRDGMRRVSTLEANRSSSSMVALSSAAASPRKRLSSTTSTTPTVEPESRELPDPGVAGQFQDLRLVQRRLGREVVGVEVLQSREARLLDAGLQHLGRPHRHLQFRQAQQVLLVALVRRRLDWWPAGQTIGLSTTRPNAMNAMTRPSTPLMTIGVTSRYFA